MRRLAFVVAIVLAIVAVAAIVQLRAARKADDLKQHHAKQRADRIEELYEDLIAPTPTLILTGQKSITHIFSPAVRGRVTPVGQFHDAEAVNEYFFGLAATPTTHAVDVEIQSLTVSGDKVAIEVDIRFLRADSTTFTLRQTGFFTFDQTDRVTSFDLSILNLGAAVNARTNEEREASIQGLCAALTGVIQNQPALCSGEYAGANAKQQFASCVQFMHSIPYGTWDRANSNTVVCRQLHTLLTPYRPDVHCPHAGPTGGHACVDFTYESFFDDEF